MAHVLCLLFYGFNITTSVSCRSRRHVYKENETIGWSMAKQVKDLWFMVPEIQEWGKSCKVLQVLEVLSLLNRLFIIKSSPIANVAESTESFNFIKQ